MNVQAEDLAKEFARSLLLAEDKEAEVLRLARLIRRMNGTSYQKQEIADLIANAIPNPVPPKLDVTLTHAPSPNWSIPATDNTRYLELVDALKGLIGSS